jgi:hypothetical protein
MALAALYIASSLGALFRLYYTERCGETSLPGSLPCGSQGKEKTPGKKEYIDNSCTGAALLVDNGSLRASSAASLQRYAQTLNKQIEAKVRISM